MGNNLSFSSFSNKTNCCPFSSCSIIFFLPYPVFLLQGLIISFHFSFCILNTPSQPYFRISINISNQNFFSSFLKINQRHSHQFIVRNIYTFLFLVKSTKFPPVGEHPSIIEMISFKNEKASPNFQLFLTGYGRGERIWTSDHLNPIQSGICGSFVNLDNLLCIYPSNNEVKVCCKKPECYEQVLGRQGWWAM